MLTAAGITKAYGPNTVLSDVSVSVGPGARLGVVGPNGVGKTTLLRILAGLEQPDRGTVARAPAGLRVGYLPQENDAERGETLLAYLARRTGVAAAERILERRTAELESAPGSVEAYSEALDDFLTLGGDDLAHRAAAVCAELGLPPDRLDVGMHALSGGQVARAALAAILLARFDVLLLDEPTNDLDFAGLDKLESFLAGVPGATVVISHDRAFLDRTVSRLVEIQEETHHAVEYAGGWTEFVAARDLARAQQAEQHGRYTAERDRLEARARTQRAWADRGARGEKKAPRDNDKAQRDFRINRTEKQAAKVRATERALDRLDVVEKPWEGWRLALDLAPATRSGDLVARLDGAVVRRGTFQLGPLDVDIRWADRVALLGPNGSGKTTLLGAIRGTLPLAAGTRRLGPGVVVGELDQLRGFGTAAASVLDAFVRDTGMRPQESRALLAKFGLGAGHALRPPERLSPGERTRAELAVLMARGVNCLVLDEPTNHLDLEAIEQLEGALAGYTGTMILVTHDRRFLESVHITRTIDLGASLPTG